MVFFMPRMIIFVNGQIPDLELVRRMILPGDKIIAANGGTHHALALGMVPSVVIGDLDSLTSSELDKLDEAGTEICRYSGDKNETDFELALKYSIEAGYREILVIAALGDRLDQTLGNLGLLTNPWLATVDVRLDNGKEEAFFIRNHCQVQGMVGDLVSLVPWGRKVAGVTTSGLRWSLRGETLYPYKTRGISNELVGKTASVSVQTGLLLIIHTRH
jgi:thiamine pyrophosphokinase